uniref:Uncharacterized protein n=1 Tax=Arundo donax TaxID=35708 RepID=A0A0A9GZ54_ARUDO
MGQSLAIAVDDYSNRCLCKTEVKPWLFSKRKGSKVVEVDGGSLEIIWDLFSTKFGAGPEPLEGFYVALVYDLEAVLVLGDRQNKEGDCPVFTGCFTFRCSHDCQEGAHLLEEGVFGKSPVRGHWSASSYLYRMQHGRGD